MSILALDLATHTGFAIIDNGKVCESGEWDFTRAEGEHYGHMFRKLEEKLGKFDLYCIDTIAYELAHHRGGAATRITTGMNAVALMYAAQCNARVHSFHTATLKKWATGNGKAKKPDMMAWVTKRIGREVIHDNEADAIVVGLYAYSLTNRVDPF